MSEQFYLLVFDSTALAIRSEKLLAGLPASVMPSPSEVTAGCGISLRISVKSLNDAARLLNENGVSDFKLYFVEKDGLRKKISYVGP